MYEIAEDLKDVTRWNSSKIMCWLVKKLTGNSQSELVPIKDTTGATVSEKGRVKDTWIIFKNILNSIKVTGNNTEKNQHFVKVIKRMKGYSA